MDVEKHKDEFEKALAAEYGLDVKGTTPPPESPENPTKAQPEAETREKPGEGTPEDPTKSEVDDKKPDENFNLEDEFKKLHPKVLEAIEADRRASKSAVGRVSFLNSKADRLERELRELKELGAIAPQGQPAAQLPQQPALTKVERKLQLEKLEALKKTDPEYATAVEEALEELDRRHVEELSKLQELVSPFQKQVVALETKIELDALSREVPDFTQIKDSREFADWAYAKGIPQDEWNWIHNGASKAAELIPYFKAFKHDWNAYQEALKAQQPVQEGTPAPDTARADQVVEDRAKKLQQPSVDPASPTKPKAQVVDLNDPKQAQKEFDKVYAELYKD